MHGNNPLPIILIVLTVVLLLDWYVFQGIRVLTESLSSSARMLVHGIYWGVNIIMPVVVVMGFISYGRTHQMAPWQSWFFGIFITILITKLVFLIVMFGQDIYRLIAGGVNRIADSPNESGNYIPSRRKFVSQLAIGIAAIPFTSFIYGMVKGKYEYKVHKHTLYFPDLPAAFDGFKIVQISDVHSGSFDDAQAVSKGVDMIKAQQGDVFVFTGDLVNNDAKEFEPWVEMFGSIKAPHGQYSILGNHDYGDYVSWPSPEAKIANLNHLKKLHADTGFRLMLDEHIPLEKNGEKIYLMGIENWGLGFGERGDLHKAISQVPHDAFKVLLSHDPSHWDAQAKNHEKHIHLTLAGHTHGMQMGVEIPGFKWSPVKYRYPKWAGVYEEAGRYINVNRGFGFIGFSGRVGIWPEISVIELKRKA
jgi:predicted MPP superfamily phosphohydrolase